MRAAVFEVFGDPAAVLETRNIPTPEPGPGKVRVKMLASPINPSDLMVVRGTYGKLPKLPATPGFEGVGIVETGGGLLGRFLKGRRVAVLNGDGGNWAEQAIVSARQVVPISSKLTLEQAATFFVNPATAYILTHKVLAVPRGEWLLQTAAGSQVGRMVIRLGQHAGFKTLNIVRRQEQVAELKVLGADVVLLESEIDLPGQIRQLTDGGVKYAIDPVGGPLGSQVVRSLGHGGKLVLYGTLSDQPLSFSPRDLMSANGSIIGFWLGHWMAEQNLFGKLGLMRTLGGLINSGVLTSDIAASYSLDQISAAVQAANAPGRSGKVLLKMS